MILKITDENIAETLSNGKITLLDFWAPWCGPCKMLGPIIDELSTTNQDVNIGKINVDENKDSALKYNVRGIPTMLFFKDGELVETIVGVKPKAFLQEKIDSLKA